MMERASEILGRLMLGIFFCVVALAMLITAKVGLSSHSYLLAMAIGALGAAAYILLQRRFSPVIEKKGALYQRLGENKTAFILALICFAVHLLWVLIIRIEPFSDYETYWQCACARAFGEAIDSTEYLAVYPHILGYSTFLSFFLRIFGRSVMVGTVLNSVLTAISGFLIFRICRRLLNIEAAVTANIIWIFMPTKLMLGSLIFSEPLYTCLLLAFMLAIVELEANQYALKYRLPVCAVIGIALGLLIRAINIVRPIVVILIIAYVIWLVFLRGRDEKDKRLWLVWGLITLCMLCTYKVTGSMWDRHVESVLGEEPAGLPIYNIYVGFNEETQGQWSAEDMDVLFAYKRGENLSAGEAQMKMLPHLQERLSSGIDFPRLFTSKLHAFMGNDELGGYTYRYTRSESFVKICMIIDNIYYFAVIALMLVGIAALFKGRRYSSALLIPLFSLGLTLAHLLVEVSTRYHYSLIPMFIITAAFAASKISTNGGKTNDTETVYSNSVL